jgi:hypothetical protein
VAGDDDVKATTLYRTESGMIFRVIDDGEGHISVGILKGSAWEDANIGVLGLRVAPTTVRLTAAQVRKLPP